MSPLRMSISPLRSLVLPRIGSVALTLILLSLGWIAETVSAQELRWRNHQSWSTEDGLPQSSVHQILQSRDGYLWLATEGGVARYDGVGFQVFRHDTDPAFVSDDVAALAADPSGAVWFGTSDGLIRLAAGRSRRFSEADGLPSSTISALALADDGSLLALSGDAVVRFDGRRFAKVPEADSRATMLSATGDGRVWIVANGALLRYGRGHLTREELPGEIVAKQVTGITASSDGTVWLTTEQRVIASRQGATRVWELGRELPGSRIESVSVDRTGRAWVGTNRGLVTLSSSWDLSRVDALSTDAVLCSFEDEEGNEWIGTETSGLHALRQRTFHGEPGIGEEAVTTVVQAVDGAMWLGTRDDGVRRMREGVVDAPVAAERLTSPVILSMAAGLGEDVWVGTPDGLNHVEGGRVQQYTSSDGLPDDFIGSLLVSGDGSVWVGTRRGLAHLQHGRIEVTTRAEGLASDLVGVLFASWDTRP